MHDPRDILPDQEEIDREIDREKPSTVNRLFIGVVTVLLLGLFVSYFVFAPIDHVLRGRLTSESVQDGVLRFGDLTLRFRGDTADYLSQIYRSEQELRAVETSACLQGGIVEGEYVITEVFRPRIIEQFYNHVSFETCPTETIIMLHTHPYQHCEASTTDIDTFERRKQINEDLLMIVMCAPNRYVVYS